MSSRKSTTITGCKGIIRRRDKFGILIDVHPEEHSCSQCVLTGSSGCNEFRGKTGFKRIREMI